MKALLPLYISLILFSSCGSPDNAETAALEEPAPSPLSGKELATAHCSRCHRFVEPQLLPKKVWQKNVLPAMGHRLGIHAGNKTPDSLFDRGVSGSIVREANIYPDQPLLARADWEKIEKYFLDNAPDSVPPLIRDKPIRNALRHFTIKIPAIAQRPPLTTLVKILPKNRGILFNDSKPRKNTLVALNPDLTENYSFSLPATPVQLDEKGKEIFLTTTGNGIFPTDAPAGSIQRWQQKDTGKGYQSGQVIIPRLQRPVCLAYGDLDKDGLEDMVICAYGNQTGELAWYQNQGKDQYSKHVLRNKPGAIAAVVKDANNDGLPDIYVLMAQGDETLLLYENQGKGIFREKQLLSFSPLNGSVYFELADFNKDGKDDILYVCGDNADKSPILKSYHGIYIFLNEEQQQFRQAYFFPMNGAYKAMARDYDMDGDLDIAAISFFPDYIRYPEESFIYLDNKGGLQFDAYSFPQAAQGRWMVMDVNDKDGDGDMDIVLGSFVYFIPDGDTTGLSKWWMDKGPSLMLLENTIR